MKAYGFTLAEVLITMGIIGVVAALSSPALVSEVSKAKVGPSISKMMSTIETANQHILNDNDATLLSSIVSNDTDAYLEELSKYVKGRIEDKTLDKFEIKPKNISGGDKNSPSDVSFATKKVFTFASGDAIAIHLKNREANARGVYKGTIAYIWYDINGYDTKPNRTGKDIFLFRLDDSGAVYPDGGKTQLYVQPDRDVSGLWWNNGWGSCNENTVQYGIFCGASIVDNNFKVIYKY